MFKRIGNSVRGTHIVLSDMAVVVFYINLSLASFVPWKGVGDAKMGFSTLWGATPDPQVLARTKGLD